jgi:hypothetical protein
MVGESEICDGSYRNMLLHLQNLHTVGEQMVSTRFIDSELKTSYKVPYQTSVEYGCIVNGQSQTLDTTSARCEFPPNGALESLDVLIQLMVVSRIGRGGVEESPAEKVLDIFALDISQRRTQEPLGDVFFVVGYVAETAIDQRATLLDR